jgi:hypothetical protein
MGDVEPPSGLGNFKGVMLCNRPEEGPTAAEAGPRPFKSAVAPSYGEQLGLNPPPKEQGEVSKSTKPVNEALVRHKVWVKELAAHVAETKKEETLVTTKENERNQAVVSFCEKQREQVKGLKELAKKAGKEINREDLAKAVQGKLKKPKWALTQDAVEELDEEEAVELLDFADNLNFDEYMNDLGFREGIAALKGRAGKLQKEQNDFKNMLVAQFNEAEGDEEEGDAEAGEAGDEEEMAIEGDAVFDEDQMSMMTSHTGVSQEDRKYRHRGDDWDSSTRTSESMSVDPEELEFSKRALRDNPEMAKVHSAASVQKIAEKVKQEKEAEAAAAAQAKAVEDAQKKIVRDAKVAEMVAAMSAEKAPPAPLIQVHVEDARCNKPVDPSMLPYLYRSPAI